MGLWGQLFASDQLIWAGQIRALNRHDLVDSRIASW
jgi:hypothetical protein